MIVHLLLASTLAGAPPRDFVFVLDERSCAAKLYAARPKDCGGGGASAILVPVKVTNGRMEPQQGSKGVRFNPLQRTGDWQCLKVAADPSDRVPLYLHRSDQCDPSFPARRREGANLYALSGCANPVAIDEEPSQEEVEAAHKSVKALPDGYPCRIRGWPAATK